MSIQEKAKQRCQWLPVLDKSQRALYINLADEIAKDIASGRLQPGNPLPPQRLLADALGVTLGTITRAYQETERRGLTEAKVGSGTRVKLISAEETGFFHLAKAKSILVDLSLSMPPPYEQKTDQIAHIFQSLAGQLDQLHDALDYQSDQGNLQYRTSLADWMQAQNLPIEPEELILTAGGQHADFITLQALIKPGEAVASSALTYPGMIAAARQLSLKHIPIPSDNEGINPAALDRLCEQVKIRLVYLMPEYNNPSCEHMSQQRREAIVAVARKHDLLLLEDGVQFVETPHRGKAFFEIAPERSFYIFSVSKILSGGLRLGALRSPANLIPRIKSVLRAQCWSIPNIMAMIACRWLHSPIALTMIQQQNNMISKRLAYINKALHGFRLTSHPVGIHVWLELPEYWRALDFVAEAEQRGVLIMSSEPFCVGKHPAPQAVRISLGGFANHARFEHGVDVLLQLLKEGPIQSAPLI